MSDSFGGLINIVLVTFFIVFALGYIAFNINYTKAFRVKDKIIDLYEKNNGDCSTGACLDEIKTYAREIGYKPNSLGDYNGYSGVENLFLYQEVIVDDSCSNTSTYQVYPIKRKYYKIVTKVNMEIPIISNILPFKFFYVTGSTQIIETKC